MRTTTINHAFAAAIAPHDKYVKETVEEAILGLGQDPEQDLQCVYCGAKAETWDHIGATVKATKFSGLGHRLGNLLPCCKPCNSAKGSKSWEHYMDKLHLNPDEQSVRRERIRSHIARYSVDDSDVFDLPEYEELRIIRNQVLDLFTQADQLASQIRSKRQAQGPTSPTTTTA